MAPSPIPAPLPPWAKAALWLAPMVGGYLYDLLTHANAAPTVMQWRHLQVRAKNSAALSVVQDDAFIGFDLVNITGGNVDNSWTTSDYTTCEALFDTFWTSWKPQMANFASITEYRWYKREFADLSVEKPFLKSGPPERVTVKAIAGTNALGGAPQVAFSITEKTAWPKHWGRFYMPFPVGQIAGNTCRFQTTSVDSVATMANTLYNGLSTAEFFPVVPVTQVDKVPSRGLITVDHLQLDDVPDVIRRRRPRNTGYRKILP